MVAILAATNVVSKYALKVYTEDPIRRIPWDVILYQTSDIDRVPGMKEALSRVDGVSAVVETGSIKLGLGTHMHVEIGGARANIPWFMIVSSERPDLLPPAISPANGESITALVGPQAFVSPYLSKISVGSAVSVLAETDAGSSRQAELFRSEIRHLATTDRLEIVKFFLDKFGSAGFIPDGALIFSLPKETFDTQAPRLAGLVHQYSEPQLQEEGLGYEGEARSGPQEETMGAMLLPEFLHLLAVDRSRIFTGWDLDSS